MKHYRELLLAAAFFMALSAIIYLIHYAIFGDDHHIFIFMLSDLAFLPLEVFLVVILIERIISRRETASKLEKMNMVVGAFFSEVGNRLLGDLLPGFDAGQVEEKIAISRDWTPAQFRNAASGALEIGGEVDIERIDLEKLRGFLLQKRAFLVSLLENPQLLEHDRFTDMLWPLFHLAEELEVRPSFADLPASDLAHIAGDIERLYGRLAAEWLLYAEHLKAAYPYLFSLVLRTHPFQAHPSPVVA